MQKLLMRCELRVGAGCILLVLPAVVASSSGGNRGQRVLGQEGEWAARRGFYVSICV